MLAEAWGKLSIAELRNGEERLSILLVFGIVYFFFLNPLVVWVQLGSRIYRVEGRGWCEQDWPIALAAISRPCSREVGPVVRLPAGSVRLQIDLLGQVS